MLPPAATDHYEEQRRFALIASAKVRKLWAGVGDDFDAGWLPRLSEASAAVRVSQSAAAVTSAAYTPALLQQSDVEALPVGDLDTTAFSGVSRYGTPVAEVLLGATTVAKGRVRDGWSPAAARGSAGKWLMTMTQTLVADTGRSVNSADIAQRPQLGGYIRMLNPPSCKLCIPLAGKWFRWNQGFQRHPKCDCIHVASPSEDFAKESGFVADPYEHFNSLSKSEQDALFGENDAQAIRDGGDIYRVTNTRTRGLAKVTGRSGWQARRYGTPSKMTVDDIYFAAGNDRKLAVSMLEREGYIPGPQTVGGNIKGRYFEGYAGSMGRGGTRKGATLAFQQAQRTGIRDPFSPIPGVSLDSATQTAAERRLHTAYLNHRAVAEGRNPFGQSALTQADRDLVAKVYAQEVLNLPNQPLQVRQLAQLLGMH